MHHNNSSVKNLCFPQPMLPLGILLRRKRDIAEKNAGPINGSHQMPSSHFNNHSNGGRGCGCGAPPTTVSKLICQLLYSLLNQTQI
jgi:hypothetical protein